MTIFSILADLMELELGLILNQLEIKTAENVQMKNNKRKILQEIQFVKQQQTYGNIGFPFIQNGMNNVQSKYDDGVETYREKQ